MGFIGKLASVLRPRGNYKPISTEDAAEGGRIRLPGTPRVVDDSDEATEALLNHETTRQSTKRPRKYCVFFGFDCSLLFKVLLVVGGLWAVYVVIAQFNVSFNPAATGLENLPEFGTSQSMECSNAYYFYQELPKGLSITVPVNQTTRDHTLKLVGTGIGTVTITNAPADSSVVSYHITIRGSRKDVVAGSEVEIEQPDSGSGPLRIGTPNFSEAETCMRYDVTMAVPSSVKELNIHSRSVAQVKFAEDARFDFSALSIVLFKLDNRNLLISSPNVFSEDISYEIYRGWIVGDVTVSKMTHVVSQRSDGVVNLKVHPAPPSDPAHPQPATFQTTTGHGRTDVVYVGNPDFKRTINSKHLSQQNGDVNLNYKDAKFEGKIKLESKTSTIVGGSAFNKVQADGFTHYAGDMDGKDRIEVFSHGWTGLYF
ncbi:hypothetical protein FA15DRAFT_703930 [Coprinopsis marcescibilis]|uniref:Adhesin domain-containing protein n=1 Tax=Coprinopsis marcescibilis TaxID=230819 RepID=A0A5C3KX26_COPMA|nr:hypothetical protein FA15DRAFT_703930 [Coprinopsis marcescibilis]